MKRQRLLQHLQTHGCIVVREGGKHTTVKRIRGSHHIFTREAVEEILNLQPKRGKAKAYQVAQVRDLILNYGLAGEDDVEV